MTSLNQWSNIEAVINHAYMTFKDFWNNPFARLGRAMLTVELIAIFGTYLFIKSF